MNLKGIVAATALGAMLACGVSIVGGVSPAYAATAKPSKKIKRDVALKLQAAQKDIQKGHYKAGIAALNKMAGMSDLKSSQYATHIWNQLYVFAYEKTNQYSKLAPKLEVLLKDPFESTAAKQRFTKALAQIYYQLHDYDKAIKYGTEALNKHYPGAASLGTLVGQAYYLKGDWKQTIKFEQARIHAAISAGHKPTKHSLELVQSSCMKMHDHSCLLNSLEQLVVYYPRRQYWQYLLFQTFKGIKSNANLLEAYRLAFEVGVIQQPHEFIDYAELAIEAHTPGEAEQVLNSALSHHVFTEAHQKAHAQRVLKDAQKLAAKDKTSLAHTAELASKQPKGDSDIRVGLAYYGYKDYAKAIHLFTLGIAKGGLKRPAEAHLLLGIAQLKAGHKTAAIQAFKKVTAKANPTLHRLAQLWTLKAKSVG